MKKIMLALIIVLMAVGLPLTAAGQKEAAASDGTFTIGWSKAGAGDSR